MVIDSTPRPCRKPAARRPKSIIRNRQSAKKGARRDQLAGLRVETTFLPVVRSRGPYVTTFASRVARNSGPYVTRPSLPGRQERLYGNPDVLGDLPQQDRGDIPTAMERYRCASPVRMTILLMRASLSNLRKTQRLELGGHFSGLEDGKRRHSQATSTFWIPIN